MKQGWEIKKLGDITTSINGLWTGKKPPFITIAVIRNTNFTKDCKLDTSDIAYIDVEVKQYASRKLQCGDIIIEKSGGSDKQPVGRPILFNIEEGEYSFSNFTSTLRVSDKTTILPEFIHRYLAYIYMRGDTAAMQSKTTGIRNLDFNLYKSINIPVPPREEQERIVAELDCLSGVIERKREQLRELDALAQSIFYQMFGDPITNEKGWETSQFDNACELITDFVAAGSFADIKHNVKYIDRPDFAQLIRTTDIKNQFTKSDYVYVSESAFNYLWRVKLDKESIILPNVGNCGEVYYITPTMLPYKNNVLGPNAILVRSNKENNRYLSFLFKTSYFQYQLRTIVNAVGQPKFNKTALKQLSVILPPLTLQQKFADKIEAIEKQKELIKQSITQTEELFNSRMDYYFN